jgi:hypothetical protein
MAKKIRLIDEDSAETTTEATASGTGAFTADDVEKLMKFAEQIDWKLWELLKLARADAEK